MIKTMLMIVSSTKGRANYKVQESKFLGKMFAFRPFQKEAAAENNLSQWNQK